MYILALAVLFPLQGFAANFEAANARSCAQDLHTLVGTKTGQSAGSKKDQSSLNYFRARIEHNYAANNEDWFKEHALDAFKRAIDEKINWQRYHEEGLKPGERIIWIQQSMLKDLNDKLWDIGGTEYYLLQLDEALAKVLSENPRYGRIIHRNYKDRVLISSLEPGEFKSLVLSKVINEVTTKISKVREVPGLGWEWNRYMRQSLNFGWDMSMERALLDMQVSKLGLSFEQWKEISHELQIKISLEMMYKKISLEEAMVYARRHRGQQGVLQKWLVSKGINKKWANKILYYMHLTNVADMLPTQKLLDDTEFQYLLRARDSINESYSQALQDLPKFKRLFADSWDFRRATFIRELKDSHTILATDISGLGEKALLARHKWIVDGAKISTLETVYDKTSVFLDSYFKTLHDEIAQIVGGADKVRLYASGDDALWGLPDLTEAQRVEINKLLAERKDLYSLMRNIPRPGEAKSVADTIFETRDALFELKAKLKADKE